MVKFVLASPTEEAWPSKLGLPKSADGFIGPVMLLLETDGFLIVTP
jgi:hypothetical protein